MNDWHWTIYSRDTGDNIYLLTVEADGGDGVEVLVELHHVQGGRLARPVQSNHDNMKIFSIALHGQGVKQCIGVLT